MSAGFDRYEIQTKIADKWQTHDVIEGDESAAMTVWRYVSGTLFDAARLVTHDYKGRIRVMRRQSKRAGYRVVYGEMMPVWSKVLPSLKEANAFAEKCRSIGDIVFRIEEQK